MSKAITAAEVQKHTKEGDAWLIIEKGVYDVSDFLDEHPGGKKVLLTSCGGDATDKFWKFHSKKILTKTAKPMKIGELAENSKL